MKLSSMISALRGYPREDDFVRDVTKLSKIIPLPEEAELEYPADHGDVTFIQEIPGNRHLHIYLSGKGEALFIVTPLSKGFLKERISLDDTAAIYKKYKEAFSI